ncbi:MAG: DeoR/GlpR family DNA-binding transcription regulator [Anaerolineaceae bacterium]|jgi:DeoR family fructose operon transcriptional repressor
MLPVERQRMILSYLAKNGNVSVVDLCNMYNVSEMTIRRDLTSLQSQGLLKRTYGGAIPTEPAFFEISQRAKLSMFIEEKKQIGIYCANLVRDGDVVFLDSGTTTLQIAKALKGRSITVLTNDLNIASELLDCHAITLFIVGGELNRENNNLLGSKAISFFDDIRGDVLFLAVEGVDENAGFTVPDLDEVPIKRRMMGTVDKVYVVSDHSKLGRNSMGIIAPIGGVTALITDAGASGDLLEPLQEKVQILIA